MLSNDRVAAGAMRRSERVNRPPEVEEIEALSLNYDPPVDRRSKFHRRQASIFAVCLLTLSAHLCDHQEDREETDCESRQNYTTPKTKEGSKSK